MYIIIMNLFYSFWNRSESVGKMYDSYNHVQSAAWIFIVIIVTFDYNYKSFFQNVLEHELSEQSTPAPVPTISSISA